MKSLNELLNEILLNEKVCKINTDVNFENGTKEQKDTEKKFGIKFKKTREGEYDITGPRDNVKKYILTDYGLDKSDAEELFPELFE